MQPDRHAPLAEPVQALEVFAGLLSEAEAGPSSGFYSRMAEATCRLAAMRRAVVFVYDDERRLVRAVGAHGIPLDLFKGAAPTTEQVEIARLALAEDRVVEVTEHIERELPAEYHDLLQRGTMACVPMSAGGRWIGVMVADRAEEEGPVSDAQRATLWMLGKVSALAAVARNATREHELARRLTERIDLARELHEAVVQRLFGLSLALSGDGPLDEAARARARDEVQAALGELRAALQRPLARASRVTATTVHAEVERLHRAGEPVRLVEGGDVTVPPALEPVAQSVLREAVRNAAKHADATTVDIALRVAQGTFVLEVVNDGVGEPAAPRAAGMGLRLAAFEALGHGGVVDFGPLGNGRWRVRLTVPLDGGAPA